MMIFIFFSCVLFAYLYAEDNMQTIFHNLTTPFFVGVLAVALIVLLLGATFHIVSIRAKRGKSQRRFSLTIDYLVENVYNFFEEILGERAPFRVKSYITNLFLVILIANLIGVILDILISPFPVLATYIKSPTSDISFTLALAIVSVVMVLVVEATTKGGGRFLYRYIPFFGTNIIRLSKETLSSPLYYLLRPFVKLFDIFISLFIALLDIIGTFAKVISLAFRLYGNMIAGSLLLAMILMMMGNLTKNWLAGREVPLLIPLIFYLQSTLTAVVQAFAFSLLTSVFIKVALDDSPPEKKNLKETPVHQQLVQSIQR